jgi:DNA-directed RNA polymerase subunit beta
MVVSVGSDRVVSPRLRRCFSGFSSFVFDAGLLSTQRDSYESFLSSNGKPGRLSELFGKFMPVWNSSKTVCLEFIKCYAADPRFSAADCAVKNLTYSVPIHGVFRIRTDAGITRDQEVYLGDLPHMTESGSFVINGVERVVVSQMHRAPGVVFLHDEGKVHSSGKYIFSSRVIPYRGSWLDMEFDSKDVIYSRIDKKRKFPVTTLLMALGGIFSARDIGISSIDSDSVDTKPSCDVNRSDILNLFYKSECFDIKNGKIFARNCFQSLLGCTIPYDILAADSSVLLNAGIVSDDSLKLLSAQTPVDFSSVFGAYVSEDVVDQDTGEMLLSVGDLVSEESLRALIQSGYSGCFKIIMTSVFEKSPYLLNTLLVDKNHNTFDALCEIYSVARPGDTPSLESARELFRSFFFDGRKYDLSRVGRAKINESLGINIDSERTVLVASDVLGSLKKLIEVRTGQAEIDDIDALSCRRLRSVGEFFENQCYLGLSKIERPVYDALNASIPETVMPSDVIGIGCLDAVLRDFMLSSPLSQFMDQTNPLSDISHKRRVSALGPGALSRDRANLEVRDVHASHYGRICPIETPEGPNIGLVSSLSMYARVNAHGFLETPYYPVKNGKISEEIVFLSSSQEIGHKIAQANDCEDGFISPSSGHSVFARINGKYVAVDYREITLAEISYFQICSPAAALIPFLEHDDSNRALMGSNMQRQAVPLVKPEAPLVGTGVESIIARDSGAVVIARRSGRVAKVDSSIIIIAVDGSLEIDVYSLEKFGRSNAGTCINQRPMVTSGDIVKAGDVISDGSAIDGGDLALGRNVRVAFLSFFGRNFEDSIVISERVADEEGFASVHIFEHVCKVMDGKSGVEEVTRSVPNVSSEKLSNLDEFGMVVIGSKVVAGDVLVGKVMYKVENSMTPEEKLLRAVFGDGALDVKDVSLRVPVGIQEATVVDVRVSVRKGDERDEAVLFVERQKIERLVRKFRIQKSVLSEELQNCMRELIGDHSFSVKNTVFQNSDALSEVNSTDLLDVKVKDEDVQKKLTALLKEYHRINQELLVQLERDKVIATSGDDLSSGIMKVVRVFLAVKRRLKPGDKMAGRHGNKGVVSCVLPVEDMPFTDTGESVDLVLTPVGLPSRMNIGQIMESVLGRALRVLGHKVRDMLGQMSDQSEIDTCELRSFLQKIYQNKIVSEGVVTNDFSVADLSDQELIRFAGSLINGVPVVSPVFAGISDEHICSLLELAGLDSSGKIKLSDGRTGDAFDRPVTVGEIYFLKLHHLVDDKLHARSIGPYSLVTQQPLGGKAQFGGQRLGEMEVWALEAYGAAHVLREMLTIKSDATAGRVDAYSDISTGVKLSSEDWGASDLIASFNVLQQEMKALCLNIELQNDI